MRLTRTALRELTKKYRAVLRNCALSLLATMCVVNNAKADDSTAYTNATNSFSCDSNCYYGNGTDAVSVSTDSSLGQALTSSDKVYGYYTADGSDQKGQYNVVNMYSGKVDSVYGTSIKDLMSQGNQIHYNTVNILGGTINKAVYGGEGYIAHYNRIMISGTPKFGSGSEIYGGSSFAASNYNVVSISGKPRFNDTKIYGGEGGFYSQGNTLITKTKDIGGIKFLSGFQNYVFVIPSDANTTDTLLSLNEPLTINSSDKIAVLASNEGLSNFNVGDSIVLIDNATGTATLDMSLLNEAYINPYVGPYDSNYVFSVSFNGTKLIATLDEILSDNTDIAIDEKVVNGLFTGAKNAINSTNEAVKTSIKVRLSQLSGVPTSSSSASSKKGQSGGDEDEKYGLWAQALYNHVKRNSSSNSVGFKGHSEGIVIGSDTEVIDDFTAGLAYSYTKSNMKSVGEKTDIKTHGFFAYGQYKPNEYFVNGSIGFGLSKADPKDGDDDVKSKFYSVDALAGYETSSDYGMIIPAAGLRYVRIEQKSYNDGEIRLKAKDSNTLTAVAQLGWKNDYKVDNTNLTARVSLGFIYDLKSDNNKVNITTGNAHLLSEDGRLKRFGTELNAGVDTKLNNQWGLSLDYNGEYRQHYKNHTGTVSVKYDF